MRVKAAVTRGKVGKRDEVTEVSVVGEKTEKNYIRYVIVHRQRNASPKNTVHDEVWCQAEGRVTKNRSEE